MREGIKIAIKSCAKYADRRLAQENTWLLDCQFPYFYQTAPAGASDGFNDIAPKVVQACKYALETNTHRLFICDDDTYVRPERLLTGSWENDYVGFVRTGRNGALPYIQGSSFWLSKRAMTAVVRYEDLMINGVPDDVAVGRVMYAAGIPFTHEHRFGVEETYPHPDRVPLATNRIISCHKCLPDAMYEVHKRWLASQKEDIIGGARG